MRRLSLLALGLLAIVLIVSQAYAQAATPWAPNTYYAVGALVTYNGVTYKCLQAHTSLVSQAYSQVSGIKCLMTWSINWDGSKGYTFANSKPY